MLFFILLSILRCIGCSMCDCYRVRMVLVRLRLFFVFFFGVICSCLCWLSRWVRLWWLWIRFWCWILVGWVVSIGVISVWVKKLVIVFGVILLVVIWLRVWIRLFLCGGELIRLCVWWWWMWCLFLVILVSCRK